MAAAKGQSSTRRARAQGVLRVAVIGVVGGAGLATAAALLVPILVAIDPDRAEPLRLFAFFLGAAHALSVALFGPSGEPAGARLATRVGSIAAVAGAGASLIGGGLALGLAAPLSLPFSRLGIIAAAIACLGLSLVSALFTGVAAASWRGQAGAPSAGMPLPFLVGGSVVTLTVATWALATSHVIGHLDATARQIAVDEARDLVRLLDGLPPDELERAAAELAPPGGFLGRVDARGRVVPGVGAGLPSDAVVTVSEGPPTVCRVDRRNQRLPCAVSDPSEGTRLVAAVTEVPVPLRLLLAFGLVGVIAAIVAFIVGEALGRGPAQDLERVATALDELGSMTSGLDRPIHAVSLDEVGDLAVALAHLRVRLQPGLVEHDEALRRASQADDDRDRFLALVSEELRAPLDRILTASRVLLEGHEPLTAPQREDVRLIVSSATHLNELIEEVLDLSAIATGQVRLRRADVDLAALVSDVARAQRPLLGTRQVELQLELPQGGARLDADERRLRQVVTNLVSNAVKFTQAGSITIRVERVGDEWLIGVADTGPGIAAEQLPQLFTEFVQLGTVRQRARGTGLGLAICKRLIEAHGGRIGVESQPGAGTTFTVRLPAQEAR